MLFSRTQAATELDAQITSKTEAALDTVLEKKNDLLSEGITIVGGKVDEADTFKYDKIGKITGQYYCRPGYCTFPPLRRRALLQAQSERCVECGPDAYCPGGFQSLTEPNRVECPTPDTGSNIADFTTNGTTTATSRNQCLVDTVPGYYATDNVYGPALACGYGFYCPGGVQQSAAADRVPCPPGTNTTITNAGSKSACTTGPTGPTGPTDPSTFG